MGQPLSRLHVPALDGVRGLAILLVLAAHGSNAALPGRAGLPSSWHHWLQQGSYGVDLFFVLSGYLITGILLDTRDGAGYFRTFYWRRALRIFPAYYMYLAFVFGGMRPFLRLSGDDPWAGVQLWPFFLYVQNWMPGRGLASLLSHLWSLAIEEQFYLVWPTVVYLMPRRGLGPLCVVLAVGALGLRCLLATWGCDVEDAHRLTPARLDTLLLGALLALAIRNDGWRTWCQRWMPRLGWSAVAGVVVLAPFTHGFDHREPVVYTVGWSLTALIACALVWAAATAERGVLHRAFGWGWLRAYGRYSYGIYLWQSLLAETLPGPWLKALLNRSETAYRVGVFTFPLVLALAVIPVVWLSWNCLEQPCLRLKDRFRYAGR